jgi:N-acyl-D-aspartate/D-glutamate deacylase
VVHDLVIRNGMVVDGSGGSPYRADVGVKDGTIVTIGRIRDRAAEEVDAEGHIVAPGFVEIHTHMDAQAFWDPLGTCSSWHGVTTAIMGNCGFTIAPCREADKDLVLRSLERAEDISRNAMLAGIEWQWDTYPQYLDALDRTPKGINYGGYVGHSALRTFVMGERAFDEPGNDDDVAAMRRELEAGLRAGALGFSTSRSANHETSDDRPVPSRLASWDEVRSLVGVMGDLGVGVFELANEPQGDDASRQDYRRRLRELAIESGRPLTFIIAHAPSRPELSREYLEMFDESAALGAHMFGQVHSREFLSVIGFRCNLPFDRLPGWAELRRQPLEAQRAALLDPDRRRLLVEEAEHGDYGRVIGAETRKPTYESLRSLDSGAGPWRMVADVAAEKGASPVDVMLDLSLDTDFNILFGQPFANDDREFALKLIRHPRTIVGVSDSGAHVSQIIDSSIPTFLLAHWVREKQALTWAEAIRMLTFDPASAWSIPNRGLVQTGYVADLVVIDPETVGPAVPYAANDLPSGAKRLKQEANGILATVVNGRVLLRDGQHTGALPGKVIRGPLAAHA